MAAMALCAASLAQAADVRAYPDWSSDQVRAARPNSPSTALVFDVQSTVRMEGRPDKATHETVTLAPSFIFVDADDGETLDDGTLCRTFTWVRGKPTLHSESCYAVPAFRTFELANREVLQRVMEGFKVKDAPLALAPYWRESELGVQRTASDPLVKVKTGDEVDYRLGAETVVRVSGSAIPFQSDEARRFVKFAALHTQLHPQVRRDLLVASALPQTLEIVGQSVLKKRRETLIVSNVRRVVVAYPLPAGLTSDLRAQASGADDLKQKGMAEAIRAIEGRPSTPKPSLDDLLAAAKRAAADGRQLDVLLLFIQLTQDYGPKLMTSGDVRKTVGDEVRPLLQRAYQDPETAHFALASGLSGKPMTPSERQAAASFLAHDNLDDRPYGTFRYVTFANLVRGSSDVAQWGPSILRSMPSPLVENYWVHIAAHPWSSLTYKDAGDAYLQTFDTSDAWLAYDLGREVDKDWRLGTMQALSTFEDQMRSAQPNFF
jgi:hypothetical protein